MSRSDMLRAELAVAELEAELVAAKEAGGADTDLKERLREARRQFRLLREGSPPEAGVARARPAAAAATAKGGRA